MCLKIAQNGKRIESNDLVSMAKNDRLMENFAQNMCHLFLFSDNVYGKMLIEVPRINVLKKTFPQTLKKFIKVIEQLTN